MCRTLPTPGANLRAQCLCCTATLCAALGEPLLGLGHTTHSGDDGCTMRLVCCSFGYRRRSSMHCDHSERCLCCSAAASLPVRDGASVPAPVCAYCGVSCRPLCGCCKPPPAMRDHHHHERDDSDDESLASSGPRPSSMERSPLFRTGKRRAKPAGHVTLGDTLPKPEGHITLP